MKRKVVLAFFLNHQEAMCKCSKESSHQKIARKVGKSEQLGYIWVGMVEHKRKLF